MKREAVSRLCKRLEHWESNLDSFIMEFRLGAKFMLDTFVTSETPFEDLLME